MPSKDKGRPYKAGDAQNEHVNEVSKWFFMNHRQKPKDSMSGDFVFSPFETAIFGVFHVMSDTSGAERKVKIPLREFVSAFAIMMIDFLQTQAALTSYVPSFWENSGWPDFDLFALIMELAPDHRKVLVWYILQFTTIGLVVFSFCVVLFVANSFKTKKVRELWPVKALRYVTRFLVTAMYPTIASLLLSPLSCSSLRDMTEDTEFDCNSVVNIGIKGISIISFAFFMVFALVYALVNVDFDWGARRPEGKAHGRVDFIYFIADTCVVFAALIFQGEESWVPPCVAFVMFSFVGINYVLRAPFFYDAMNYVRAGFLFTLSWFSFMTMLVTFTTSEHHHGYLLTLFSLAPFFFLIGGQLTRYRISEFKEMFRELLATQFVAGDRVAWKLDSPVFKNPATMTALHSKIQSILYRRGIVPSVKRYVLYNSDVELYFRAVSQLNIKQGCFFWNKMLFLARLTYVGNVMKAKSSKESSFASLYYALFIWFYYKNTTKSMELLRMSYANNPSFDVRYFISSMRMRFQSERQSHNIGSMKLDVVSVLEFRKNQQKVLRLQQLSSRRQLSLWRELRKTNRNKANLDRTVRQMIESTRDTEKLFEMLSTKFPKSKQTLLAYAHFVSDAFGDFEKSKELRTKTENDEGPEYGAKENASSFMGSTASTQISSLQKQLRAKCLRKEHKDYKGMRRSFAGMFIMTNILMIGGMLYAWYVIDEISNVPGIMKVVGDLVVNTSAMLGTLVNFHLVATGNSEPDFEMFRGFIDNSVTQVRTLSFQLVTDVNKYGYTSISDLYTTPSIEVYDMGETVTRNLQEVLNSVLLSVEYVISTPIEEYGDTSLGSIDMKFLVNNSYKTIIPVLEDAVTLQYAESMNQLSDSRTIVQFLLGGIAVLAMCQMLYSILRIYRTFRMFSVKEGHPATLLAESIPSEDARNRYSDFKANQETSMEQIKKIEGMFLMKSDSLFDNDMGDAEDKIKEEDEINEINAHGGPSKPSVHAVVHDGGSSDNVDNGLELDSSDSADDLAFVRHIKKEVSNRNLVQKKLSKSPKLVPASAANVTRDDSLRMQVASTSPKSKEHAGFNYDNLPRPIRSANGRSGSVVQTPKPGLKHQPSWKQRKSSTLEVEVDDEDDDEFLNDEEVSTSEEDDDDVDGHMSSINRRRSSIGSRIVRRESFLKELFPFEKITIADEVTFEDITAFNENKKKRKGGGDINNISTKGDSQAVHLNDTAHMGNVHGTQTQAIPSSPSTMKQHSSQIHNHSNDFDEPLSSDGFSNNGGVMPPPLLPNTLNNFPQTPMSLSTTPPPQMMFDGSSSPIAQPLLTSDNTQSTHVHAFYGNNSQESNNHTTRSSDKAPSVSDLLANIELQQQKQKEQLERNMGIFKEKQESITPNGNPLQAADVIGMLQPQNKSKLRQSSIQDDIIKSPESSFAGTPNLNNVVNQNNDGNKAGLNNAMVAFNTSKAVAAFKSMARTRALIEGAEAANRQDLPHGQGGFKALITNRYAKNILIIMILLISSIGTVWLLISSIMDEFESISNNVSAAVIVSEFCAESILHTEHLANGIEMFENRTESAGYGWYSYFLAKSAWDDLLFGSDSLSATAFDSDRATLLKDSHECWVEIEPYCDDNYFLYEYANDTLAGLESTMFQYMELNRQILGEHQTMPTEGYPTLDTMHEVSRSALLDSSVLSSNTPVLSDSSSSEDDTGTEGTEGTEGTGTEGTGTEGTGTEGTGTEGTGTEGTGTETPPERLLADEAEAEEEERITFKVYDDVTYQMDLIDPDVQQLIAYFLGVTVPGVDKYLQTFLDENDKIVDELFNYAIITAICITVAFIGFYFMTRVLVLKILRKDINDTEFFLRMMPVDLIGHVPALSACHQDQDDE